jgi:hypothetical protein
MMREGRLKTGIDSRRDCMCANRVTGRKHRDSGGSPRPGSSRNAFLSHLHLFLQRFIYGQAFWQRPVPTHSATPPFVEWEYPCSCWHL